MNTQNPSSNNNSSKHLLDYMILHQAFLMNTATTPFAQNIACRHIKLFTSNSYIANKNRTVEIRP